LGELPPRADPCLPEKVDRPQAPALKKINQANKMLAETPTDKRTAASATHCADSLPHSHGADIMDF
jgi:hypothetical protein